MFNFLKIKNKKDGLSFALFAVGTILTLTYGVRLFFYLTLVCADIFTSFTMPETIRFKDVFNLGI